jgi:hypothetical protein
MLNIADHATQLLMQLAMASGKLSFGSLQRPSEVAAHAKHRASGLPTDQWWLCANVPTAMFRTAEGTSLCHLGKLVRGPTGTLYAILAQQAGPWQHRFVLQLVGQQMREYLRAACDRGFILSLAHHGGEESLVVPDCKYLQHVISGEVVACGCPDWKAVAREACEVAVAMLNPQAVTERCLEAVGNVCVSMVASSDVYERTTRQG